LASASEIKGLDNHAGTETSRATEKGKHVNIVRIGILLSTALLVGTASRAVAQTAEPTYKADPSVYKVIFEDASFRVIEGTRKKGVHDKVHSHPVPFVVYSVTDCKTKLYAADGKTTELESKAGTATALPVIASHSAENTGNADCTQIFFEKK
jgi:hypothetical protein